MPFRNKKDQPKPVPFSDILRGLQQAINSAQDMLHAQQVQNVRGFFDADGNPVSQTIRTGGNNIDVPLMTLVSHSSLVMDDVEIKFKTKVGAVTDGRSALLSTPGGADLKAADLQMQLEGIAAGDGDVMEISIRFKAKETPEGMARVLDVYNAQL